jgi:hypothetical protein
MIVLINGYEVDVDDAIADSIIKLNENGFETFTCCAGHNTPKSFYGYICFEKRPLKKYGKPKGWEFDHILLKDEEEGQWKQSKRTIRYFIYDDEDKQNKIYEMMKNLEEWVDKIVDMKNKEK